METKTKENHKSKRNIERARKMTIMEVFFSNQRDDDKGTFIKKNTMDRINWV